MSTEYDVTQRRESIIRYLIACKRTTHGALSRKYGVSIRTIQRDIIVLSRYYAIYTQRGNKGGIYIDNKFTEKQIESMCVAIETVDEPHKTRLRSILATYASEYLV